jgi:hypothetical protein
VPEGRPVRGFSHLRFDELVKGRRGWVCLERIELVEYPRLLLGAGELDLQKGFVGVVRDLLEGDREALAQNINAGLIEVLLTEPNLEAILGFPRGYHEPVNARQRLGLVEISFEANDIVMEERRPQDRLDVAKRHAVLLAAFEHHYESRGGVFDFRVVLKAIYDRYSSAPWGRAQERDGLASTEPSQNIGEG